MTCTVTAEKHEADALEPAVQRARPVAVVELIATAALAFSTLVAITAVSIGIARADAFGVRAGPDMAPFAIALFIGLLCAMAAFTAAIADRAPTRR